MQTSTYHQTLPLPCPLLSALDPTTWMSFMDVPLPRFTQDLEDLTNWNFGNKILYRLDVVSVTYPTASETDKSSAK